MDITKMKKKQKKEVQLSETELSGKIEKEIDNKKNDKEDEFKINEIPKIFEIDKDELEEIRFDGQDKLILEFTKDKQIKLLDKEEINNMNKFIERIRIKNTLNNENPIIEQDYTIKGTKIKIRLAIVQNRIGKTKFAQFTIRVNINKLLDDKQFKDLFLNVNDSFDISDMFKDKNSTIVISGETGSGKTEVQKYLMKYIDDYFSLVSIADTNDTNLKSLFPNKDISEFFTKDKFDMGDGLRTALRWNPTYIILSEIRGEEITEFYEAISTGHKTISTIHANTGRQTFRRLTDMYNKYNNTAPINEEAVKENIDYIIHMKIRYIPGEFGMIKQRYIDTILQDVGEKKHACIYKNK